jgi:hypothetical protein
MSRQETRRKQREENKITKNLPFAYESGGRKLKLSKADEREIMKAAMQVFPFNVLGEAGLIPKY